MKQTIDHLLYFLLPVHHQKLFVFIGKFKLLGEEDVVFLRDKRAHVMVHIC